MHILIADKNLNGRHILSRALEMAGYKVSVAESGKHAISLLKAVDFDIVLMNVFQCMPSSDTTLAWKIAIKYYDESKPVMVVSCGPRCDDLNEFMTPKNQHCDAAFDLLPAKIKSKMLDKIQQLYCALRQCNSMPPPETDFSWEYFNRLMDPTLKMQATKTCD